MLIGYACVSTHEQTLDLQLGALRQSGYVKDWTYTDKISSVKADRPGLKQSLPRCYCGWLVWFHSDNLINWRNCNIYEVVLLISGIFKSYSIISKSLIIMFYYYDYAHK